MPFQGVKHVSGLLLHSRKFPSHSFVSRLHTWTMQGYYRFSNIIYITNDRSYKKIKLWRLDQRVVYWIFENAKSAQVTIERLYGGNRNA